ncbi:hypothetical protein PENTCL1PPCAC_21588 [Pristionchus entomophagus]|uniref:Ribosomal protein n=1 Tax=Pristionchus entomophagus TaxID=358040 RepID=A0AAV5TYW6_9BILA|nr:hypothetical protein PENTCL1PPCAC_21588 [Pristionchus entomophagus]
MISLTFLPAASNSFWNSTRSGKVKRFAHSSRQTVRDLLSLGRSKTNSFFAHSNMLLNGVDLIPLRRFSTTISSLYSLLYRSHKLQHPLLSSKWPNPMMHLVYLYISKITLHVVIERKNNVRNFQAVGETVGFIVLEKLKHNSCDFRQNTLFESSQ